MSKKTLLIVTENVASEELLQGLSDPDFKIISGSKLEDTNMDEYDEIVLNDTSITDSQIQNFIYPSLLKSHGVFIDTNKKH